MSAKTHTFNPLLKVRWEKAKKSLPDALNSVKDASVAAIGSYAAYMARYAADPFWDITDRRDATSAAELLDMLAEGFDPMAEAQMILDRMAARITLKLEDAAEEGGAE